MGSRSVAKIVGKKKTDSPAPKTEPKASEPATQTPSAPAPPDFDILADMSLHYRAELLMLSIAGLEAIGAESSITQDQFQAVALLAQDLCWKAQALDAAKGSAR